MPKKSILRRLQIDQDADDDFQLMKYEGGDRNDKYKEDLDGFKAPLGFNRERSGCGDCLFGLIFIAFMGSMVFLTYLGFTKGDVQKLMAPVAKFGDTRQLCGFKNETENYDNTLYPKMIITNW